MSIRFTFVALLAASLVRAHGSVSGVKANGQSYEGPFPGSGPDNDSPVRVISTLEPVRDLNSPDITCGPGSQRAKLTMEVTAGTDFEFFWRSGESGINWPHLLGPVMLSAYKCPGSARDCDPGSDEGWALIDAAGFDPERSDQWVQQRFHEGQGVPARIPAGMPNGEYLFRHEILALHVATSRGPESYTSCTQVKIVGGAANTTSLRDAGAELAAYPGAYHDGDPGLFANVFGGVNKDTYQMPGPKLFNPEASAPQPEPTQTEAPEPTATETETTEPVKTCDPAARAARKLRRRQLKKARALKKAKKAQ